MGRVGVIVFLLALIFDVVAPQTVYRRSGRAGAREGPPQVSTYFGSAFGHADSADQAGPGPQAVTPPASMLTGDLVIMIGLNRSVNVDIFSVQLDGQTWDTTSARLNSAANSAQMQWCKYNGTWSANPSMQSASGTTGLSVSMWVFRPRDGASHQWYVIGTIDTSRYAAPSADSLATLTGKTTTVDSMIVFGFFDSGDDNAWAAGTAGWGDGTPGNGLKNISGSDLSLDFVYLIKNAAGASGNVSRKQIARGADAGGKMIWMMK